MNDVIGFVKAKGCKLVNGEGREILLRGVGLGGWMLPEGYMWRMPEQADRPRRIEKMIVELLGEKKAEVFWDQYFECYTSEADIRRIAEEGFNSVRVPINSRLILKAGEPYSFKEYRLNLIDRVIDWCRKYNLYVILDLHGAPGGQTGANIDDSEHDRPELFTDEQYKRITIELWRMLAERYRDEWIVAGYDLLNEPLPDWFSSYNSQVMPLYKEITNEIRKVDKQHMIILEGVHWATDWTIFNEKFDDNLMLQFHKYWNNPDTESIRAFLDKREEWNVPIYMGEGGENNKYWYTGAFQLYEDHGISWNFWTWKKMNTNNSPCSVNIPEGWKNLADYAQGGVKPDKETAEGILWKYLENIYFDHCTYHAEVVDSILRRIPVRIPAVFYGFRGEGASFGISGKAEENIGFRVNDGVSIRFMKGSKAVLNFKHTAGEEWQPEEWLFAHLKAGDWTAYEFAVPPAGDVLGFFVKLYLNTAGGSGRLAISLDGGYLETVAVKGDSWGVARMNEKIRLCPGQHRLILKAEEGPVGVAWLEIGRYED